MNNLYELGMIEKATGRTIRPGGFALTKEALKICQFPPGAKVLDIGCGTGATVQLLREEYGLDACGLDISEIMIRRGKMISPDLPLFLGKADQLPFSGGEMDGVFAECTFSLFSDPEAVLQEIFRVLKEDGKLVISDIYYRNRPEKKIENTLQMIRNHGFVIEYWQDQSDYLNQLLADCILSGNPPSLLWDCLTAKEENKGCLIKDLKKYKPGYFLLVGRKDHTRGEEERQNGESSPPV